MRAREDITEFRTLINKGSLKFGHSETVLLVIAGLRIIHSDTQHGIIDLPTEEEAKFVEELFTVFIEFHKLTGTVIRKQNQVVLTKELKPDADRD